MDFAKRMLQKQGWTEGSGLGRNEDGRSEAIKPTLKMDKRGMGHDPGKEFTDHWWLRVFNEAAQKVGKKDQVDKEPQKNEKKKSFYGSFVQGSTLTNGIEESVTSSDSSSESENESSVQVPTLEDIHKFCGGATGHKAARHGISMDGKLERVTRQEKVYEEKLQKRLKSGSNASGEIQNSPNNNNDIPEVKKKKKKRKNRDLEDDSQSIEPAIEFSEKKKKRKKEKRRELGPLEESSPAEEVTLDNAENIGEPKRKRKKDKKRDRDSSTNEHVFQPDECVRKGTEASKKRKKDKKKEKEKIQTSDIVRSEESTESGGTEDCSEAKKKRKSNEVVSNGDFSEDKVADSNPLATEPKKKKKKKKKNRES